MPLIYQEWITRKDLQANPNIMYIFGDNLAKTGLGGQAKEMRGEPNAVGVPTKKSPTEYMDDKDWADNTAAIEYSLIPVFTRVMQYGIVIIPYWGLGTGLAKLEEKAPLTWGTLQEHLNVLHRYK